MQGADSDARRALLADVISELAADHAGGNSNPSAQDQLEHLQHTAQVHEVAGEFERSLDYHDALLELFDPTSAAYLDALRDRARVANNGLNERAVACWRDVADAGEQRDDREALAQALYHLYWLHQGEDGRAQLDQACDLCVDTDDPLGWPRRAVAQRAINDCQFVQALENDRQAIRVARSRGDRALEALALMGISISYAELGALEEAIDAQRRSITISMALRDHRSIITGRLNLILMLELQMDTQDALAEARSLLAYITMHQLSGWYAEVRACEAGLLAQLGRLGEAQDVLDAIAPDEYQHDTVATAYVDTLRAELMLDTGTGGAVEPVVTAAETAAQAFGLTALEWDCGFIRARSAAARGDFDTALATVATLPSVEDDQSLTRLALWMARLVAAGAPVSLVDRAADLIPPVSPGRARLHRVCAREVIATRDAWRAGQWTDLERVIDEWRVARRDQDMLRAQISLAASLAEHGRIEQAVAVFTAAHRQLLDGGALSELELVSAQLAQLVQDEGHHHIAESELVAGLDERERRAVEQLAVTNRYDKGKLFFSPEDANGSVWFLKSGRVSLYCMTDDGKRLTVSVLDPGAVFGENAVLGMATAGLFAEADEPVVVGMLEADSVRELIKRVPRIGINLLELVGQRLHSSQRLTEQVAFWTVDQRIMQILLDLDERYGHPTLDGGRLINRVYTHAQLAQMVNARRETVGEFLKELRSEGLIEMNKRRIVIRDTAALRARLQS